MPASELIKDLVKRFDKHRERYRSGKHNETQLYRRIDRLVYELSHQGMIYALTEDEIRIVES